mmetsp:Transcript_62013/g.156566  ORF Transcript_62013/g.156566 Transcript_62013/m.156566 type:complete len:205 (-) Transcript_62013:21-635(-)
MSLEEPHPFDSAFKLIKEMRAELQSLRAALAAEQQQRASEVSELKHEVSALREALTKEKAERGAACQNLITDLTQETTTRTRMLDDLRAQHRQQLSQLNSALSDEVRERKAGEHLRDTNASVEKSERQADSAQIHQELNAQKQNFMNNKDEQTNRLNNLTHDMELVVTYLQKVSSAWECMKGGKLLSSGRSGDGPGSMPASPRA